MRTPSFCWETPRWATKILFDCCTLPPSCRRAPHTRLYFFVSTDLSSYSFTRARHRPPFSPRPPAGTSVCADSAACAWAGYKGGGGCGIHARRAGTGTRT